MTLNNSNYHLKRLFSWYDGVMSDRIVKCLKVTVTREDVNLFILALSCW